MKKNAFTLSACNVNSILIIFIWSISEIALSNVLYISSVVLIFFGKIHQYLINRGSTMSDPLVADIEDLTGVLPLLQI